ncbi:hypothetical protein F7725_020274 [Dissostichus mawsoni]|uniref:Uncharacterized protein n=1 Tax=Dissostichus mawsoni TaxID=36200 RepID=A0A7J5YCQ8_DISMA|nr:hypothetical protein F7725_020274 [Dissostichus mawsoni]
MNDTSSSGQQLRPPIFILTGALSVTVLVFTVLGSYRSLVRTIRELRGSRLLMTAVPRLETLIAPAVVEEEDQFTQIPQQQSRTVRLSSRRLWRSLQQVHYCLHVIT